MNDNQGMKEIIKGAAIYTSGSILGPLVLFGGIGMFLDSKLFKGPIGLLCGVGVAFVFTNILLFRRMRHMTEKMDEWTEESKKQKN